MAAAATFGSWRHLAGRFLGALSPAGPSGSDDAWALSHLLPGEQVLWQRMSGPDRRHAILVARDTIALLASARADAPAPAPAPAGGVVDAASAEGVVAAALLHDVGKVESGFGTFSRVAVTVAAIATGRDRLVRWTATGDPGSGRRLRGRVARYLTHDQLGAGLLRLAGSRPVTVAWAAEHHLPVEQWTVDAVVGGALKAADGD